MRRHNLQIYILSKILASDKGLKYTEIKPEEVENDKYNYHLQYLVKDNLIEKIEDKYRITDLGKRYIEEESPIDPLGNASELFRVNVLCILINKEKDQIKVLNQKRKRHPFFGDIGIISGTVKKGELIEKAANRKLEIETGLLAEFKLVGVIRKIRMNKEKLFSDILFHVCIAERFEGNLIESNEFGENFWSNIEETIEFESNANQSSKSLIEVFNKIKNQEKVEFFYHQEQVSLSEF